LTADASRTAIHDWFKRINKFWQLTDLAVCSAFSNACLSKSKKVLAVDRLCFLHALQRQNAENLKQIFPEKEYRSLSPNFHIHVSVSELNITTMGLPFLLEELCGPILGIYKLLTDT
jgi:hypothetical protein